MRLFNLRIDGTLDVSENQANAGRLPRFIAKLNHRAFFLCRHDLSGDTRVYSVLYLQKIILLVSMNRLDFDPADETPRNVGARFPVVLEDRRRCRLSEPGAQSAKVTRASVPDL
jgi:hypothetical protein